MGGGGGFQREAAAVCDPSCRPCCPGGGPPITNLPSLWRAADCPMLLLHLQVLAAPAAAEQLEVLGELMLQSHASYSRCGLGAEGTDRLVQLVAEERAAAVAAGEQPAVHGAKITGGGSGGGGSCRGAAETQRGLTCCVGNFASWWGRRFLCTACRQPESIHAAAHTRCRCCRRPLAGTVCILAAAGPSGDAAVQRIVQVCRARLPALAAAAVGMLQLHLPSHGHLGQRLPCAAA